MKKNLLTVKLAVILLTAMVFRFSSVLGQVATLQDWTNVYHGTSQNPLNVAYVVPTGSNANRVLVVAVSSSKWTAGQINVTLSYGGQTLTAANGDMGTNVRQHTALYFLNEAGLDAAAGSTLSATVTTTPPGATMVNTDIWAAVFDQVNQASPLTNSQTYSSGIVKESNLFFATQLTINAYNQAVEVVNSYNPQQNILRQINYALDWTMIRDSTAFYKSGLSGASIRNGVANRSIPGTNISDASPTSFNDVALASMTAISLNYQMPPPPTIQTSNVSFSDVTASSFTINWTSGNGTNRIVLVKSGSAVDSDPVNGTTYTASNLFGSGSEIGTGNFVVYNGTGYNVTVNNLDANTIYHVAVFEFSGPPGLQYYLTINPASGSQLTEPETAVTNDYRSFGSGNWGTPGTWQAFNGISWVTAVTAPSSLSGVITIRNGHTITVESDVTADQVIVEAGAQVTVSSGVTWAIADGADAVDCSMDGILYNEGIVSGPGTLAFNSGSEYEHARNGGSIPAATWNADSHCLITGITDTSPSGFGQTFGILTWNCSLQTATAAINSDATVQGDFRLSGTGAGAFSITGNNNPFTLTVSGNFFQTAGIFDLNSGTAGAALGTLSVTGNFSFTGGTITESSPSGSGSIVFDGNSMQLYTSGGIFSNTINFTVAGGAYLQMGTGLNPSHISFSNGTFTLSPGATIGITDLWGITLGTNGSSGGNIRVTGTRTFDAAANYIYNGEVNQYAGDGLPATVNSLVLNNSVGAISFLSAHIVTNEFSITAGSKANLGTNLVHSAGILLLGGVGVPGGSYGGTGSGATNIRPDYFEDATGIVNNGAPDGSWLGITSEWNSASNWVGGIPSSSTHARIYSNVANQPIITGGYTAISDIVTINQGASLTITPAGSATFSTLTNSGTLYLKSDATGIASLILTAYVDNNATESIELFLTGGGNDPAYPWHYISSPIAGLSVSDAISSGGDPDASDLATYVELLVTDNKDQAWIGYDGWDYQSTNPDGEYNLTYAFDVLEVGKGYNYYSYYDATRIISGLLNTETVNKQLSYTGATDGLQIKGWNLLGNPFTSSLSWDDIAGSLPPGGEIDNAIYFTRNSSIVSYVDGIPSTTGVTGDIPPMQGFFVKANKSGQSLSLPLSVRVHSAQNRYKGAGEALPLIRLKLERTGISDETVIRLNEKAENNFDPGLDAYKLGKTGPQVSIWTSGGKVSYSINSIPFPDTETDVPVGIQIARPGTYKMTAGQLQGVSDYDVYLKDNTTGIIINLRTTPTLSFTTQEGMITDRFVIKITNALKGSEKGAGPESLFNIYSLNGLINIQTLADEWDGKQGSVELINMSGRSINRTDNIEFRKNSMTRIPGPGLRGIYFVKIESGRMKYTGKVAIR